MPKIWQILIPRIYIDTSVIGGCLDKKFEEWSNKLIGEFKKGIKIAVISDITLDELEEAPEEVQEILNTIPNENKESLIRDNEVVELAELYIKEKAITRKSYEDAQHIAIANIYKVDTLVSWNFKHIVNLERIRKYNAINLMNGYQILEIRTPREILK